MPRYLQNILTLIKWTTLSILSSLLLYLFISIIFSIIPANKDFEQSDEIDIYLLSNGVHLDIVLPLKNDCKDWTEDIVTNNTFTTKANYISFGWGDRDFYLNTPNWSDLTFTTAFSATFMKSATAMHIDYYRYLNENKYCRKIQVSKDQYNLIVTYIENSFSLDKSGNFIRIEGENYSGSDCFYEAQKSYHLFFTCNTWTNKCLKASGLKASLWTPFDKGTMFHYK